MRVAHVITGLERGGAESMLVALVGRTVRELEQVTVFSLTTAGAHGAALRAAGARVVALGMRVGPGAVAAWARLAAGLREARPDVVQTWLYHADLLGGVAARAVGRPVVWGVHTTPLVHGRGKASTRALMRACAAVSRRLPARIVHCSEDGRRGHAAAGYDDARALVIPNGVDTERFRPRADARPRLRAELGLEADAPVVGMVARYHPDKDHRLFCEAAAELGRRMPAARFVLCGAGVSPENRELAGWLREAGVLERARLLGSVDPVELLLPGLDLATLTSRAEAFPMSLAEAMSCGVPCVATDVGDVRDLVGTSGAVVPPGSATGLAEAWAALLVRGSPGRAEMGAAARQRVVEHFGLERAVAAYVRLWAEVAGGGRGRV